ncbi:MAG: hypothetical protein KDC05_09190, partial [Bacteroidales bacterium]|nr:hypothetical protein [Bacteroidales bacterium]
MNFSPLLFSVLLLGTLSVSGQNFPWNAFFGNEGAEFAYDIKETSDKGFIVAAYGSDGGSSDFYVVKIDMFGSMQWERTLSKDAYSERAFSVLESQDGSFVVVGNATGFNKPWLVKLSSEGDTLWTTQWTDGVFNNSGLLARGALLPDGRIAVVSHEGYYALDPYMFIVGENGELLEERDLESLVPLGWYSGTVINDMETTTDGGFVLTGATGAGSGSRAFIWKFDANADSSWSVIFDGPDMWMRSAQSIKQLSDDGFILTGYTSPNSTATAALRANADGDFMWYKNYPDSIYTNGTDVIAWESGEFMITEKRFSGFGTSFYKSALLRIDSLGNLLSRDLLMGSDSSTTITQIRRTSDGGFVIAGEINEYLSVGEQDLFVLKSDSLGNIDNLVIDYVWPGDVNYDGEVNMDDLMLLGVTAGTSGPQRVDTSIGWYPHYVTDWADTVVTGVNFKHADTDGNGLVEINDTLAISLNYGKLQSGSFKSLSSFSGPSLFVIPDEVEYDGDDQLTIPVYLGTENEPVQNIYGLRFSIHFDPEIFNTSTSGLDFSGNWIGSSEDVWNLSKTFDSQGRIDFGITRVDHNQTSGFGFLGSLHLRINETFGGAWDDLTFSLVFENVQAHHYSLENLPVSSGSFEITIDNT